MSKIGAVDYVVRVLHVISAVSERAGGPTTALSALCEFGDSSIEPSVVVAVEAPSDERVVAGLRKVARHVHAFPQERCRPFGFSRAFTSRMQALVADADVLHVHSMWNWASYWALVVAHRVGRPVIIRPAGALDVFDVQKRPVAKMMLGPLILRRLFHPPNVFHCTARREAENIITYGGKARREVLALPVPDLVQICSCEEARNELELPHDAPVVLFLGRLNYKKGLELLLSAIADVRRYYPKVVLLIAGDGDPMIKASMDRLIAEHSLHHNTRRLGFVSGRRKAAVLAAADILALPSMNENFGVSVVEALQAGASVLISDQVYIGDEIKESAAVHVCERSSEALCRGIMMLLSSPLTRSERRATAHTVWRERYSPQVLRPKYIELYRAVQQGMFYHGKPH